MKRNHYARKKRQLKALAKRLNHLITEGKINSSAEIDKIVLKIRLLVKDLASVFSKFEFKRVLGAAAISLGIFYSAEATAQVFEAPVENPFGLVASDAYAMPTFADLDGDGDMDLLVGEYYGGLKYYQNTGTSINPQFTSPVANPFGLTGTYYLAFPTFADLDGDGDQDLLIGELYGEMQYFENTGTASSPQFASPVASPFGLTPAYIYALPDLADMDGDGDMDLLTGEYGGALQYYENTGTPTNPAFATPVANPFGLISSYAISCPSIGDIDNDGDMDLLIGEAYGALQYFENTGSATNPQFGAPVENPFGLSSVGSISLPAVTDLDSDGDIDVLVGDDYGAMQYFKNNLITGIQDVYNLVDSKVFPNPVNDVLFIDTEGQIENIEIFNILGQSVMIIPNATTQINVSELPNGMYTLKVKLSSGETSINKIQKL